jgi:hypothetical protein
MSKDLMCIMLVDDLAVVDADEVENAALRTLRVTGTGFNNTSRVEINGIRIDSFTAASDRVLFVVPGDSLDGVAVSDMRILIYSSRWTGKSKARLLFGPTLNTRSVSGFQQLIQKIVKGILSTSGSNRFASEGGGLLQGLGATLSPDSRAQIATIVAQAISTTEANILAAQSGVPRLGLDERLMKLTLNGLHFDETEMSVSAAIGIVTMAGSSLTLPLTL